MMYTQSCLHSRSHNTLDVRPRELCVQQLQNKCSAQKVEIRWMCACTIMHSVHIVLQTTFDGHSNVYYTHCVAVLWVSI